MITEQQINEWKAFGQQQHNAPTYDRVVSGIKHDQGKLNWSLVPFKALQEVVKVLEFGSQKYAPNNWQYVDNAEERYWNAAMRHLIAYKTESETDSETGLSHLAHATCCLLFLQHLNNEQQQDNN